MAFVLKQKPTYTWPVPLIIPTDGGRREKHTFDGEFRRLPQARVDEYIRMARAMERSRYSEAEAEEINDSDAARELLAGWTGIVDDDGKEVPFSESALDKLLEIPTVASQIVRAWFDSIEVAKRKN
jgi:predicted RNA-binding protein with EMAP domain